MIAVVWSLVDPFLMFSLGVFKMMCSFVVVSLLGSGDVLISPLWEEVVIYISS